MNDSDSNGSRTIIVALVLLVGILLALLFGIVIANNEEPLFSTEHHELTADMYETYLLIRQNGHPIITWWLASPGGEANYLTNISAESFTLNDTTVSWIEMRPDLGAVLVTVTFDSESESVIEARVDAIASP